MRVDAASDALRSSGQGASESRRLRRDDSVRRCVIDDCFGGGRVCGVTGDGEFVATHAEYGFRAACRYAIRGGLDIAADEPDDERGSQGIRGALRSAERFE